MVPSCINLCYNPWLNFFFLFHVSRTSDMDGINTATVLFLGAANKNKNPYYISQCCVGIIVFVDLQISSMASFIHENKLALKC